MTHSYRQAHNTYIKNNRAALTEHAIVRDTNLPTWIKTAHPDTFTHTNLHIAYLADLYPNLWLWGPDGENHAQRLHTIHTNLDRITQLGDFTNIYFLDAMTNALPGAHRLCRSPVILTKLTEHANNNGLPLPGNPILGVDDHDTHTPNIIIDLYNHPIWDEYPEDAKNFPEFLYQFSFLSLHHAHLATLDYQEVGVAINQYNDFCTTWGIPQ